MKRLILTLLIGVFCEIVYAQQPMNIRPIVSNDGLEESTCKYIESKIQSIVSANENWETSDFSRLVLAIKIHPTRQDVSATTPVRMSMEFEVFFSVGDITDNHVFKTAQITLNGIGMSEEQAYMAAFKTLAPNNANITKLLDETRIAAENYYITNCKQIIQRANNLKETENYDEAIYLLTSIPEVCTDCYGKCMKLATAVYKQRIDDQCKELLKKARLEWMNGQDRKAASRAAEIMSGIDPNSSVYPEVKKLQNSITNKLNVDDRRDWELQMRQMQSRHETTLSLIDAAKSLGVAWLQNRPQTINKTIIRGWF